MTNLEAFIDTNCHKCDLIASCRTETIIYACSDDSLSNENLQFALESLLKASCYLELKENNLT